ncbi:MAG: ion transporter [Gammaproteobacteria bacterium]|jgi:voltage-gated sodium channel
MSGQVSWQARFESARSNRLFELFIILVIIASALLVGVKTYQLPSWVKPVIDGLDLLITLIFLVEISIRFLGEPQKRAFFRNGWNVFDTLIVLISLIPIDDTDSALVARLVRVFRVLRMVSIIPELRMLLNSLITALPRLGYVAALIFIIFYIYAAAGSLFFERINPALWGNIAVAMLTLFRVMTFEDWTDVMYETMAVYPWSWAFYLTFIFLTTFAFLNMVIGIVVNVLEEEQAKLDTEDPDRTSLANLKDELAEIKTTLRAIEERLGADPGDLDQKEKPPTTESR